MPEQLKERLLDIIQSNGEFARLDEGLIPYTNLNKLSEQLRERLVNILIEHLERDKSLAIDIFPFIFKHYLQ